MNMMRLLVLACVLAAAVALPSTQVPEDAFGEAQAAVTTMLQEGKDQGACAALAAASVKEVTDTVKSQQQILNSLDNGDKCASVNQASVDGAQNALDTANGSKKQADEDVEAALATPITFKPQPFSALKKGECGAFFTEFAFVSAEHAVKAAKEAAVTAAGAIAGLESTLEAAKAAQADAVKECQCAVRKAYNAAWTAANAANDENAKAYTMGKHMACVLAGTPATDCQVGDTPAVTPVTLADGVPAELCVPTTPVPTPVPTPAPNPQRWGTYGDYGQAYRCPDGTHKLTKRQCRMAAFNVRMKGGSQVWNPNPIGGLVNMNGKLVRKGSVKWLGVTKSNNVGAGCNYQGDAGNGFFFNQPPNRVGASQPPGSLLIVCGMSSPVYKVTDWSEWGECSAKCGGGTQSKTRKVVHKPPYAGVPVPRLVLNRGCNHKPCS